MTEIELICKNCNKLQLETQFTLNISEKGIKICDTCVKDVRALYAKSRVGPEFKPPKYTEPVPEEYKNIDINKLTIWERYPIGYNIALKNKLEEDISLPNILTCETCNKSKPKSEFILNYLNKEPKFIGPDCLSCCSINWHSKNTVDSLTERQIERRIHGTPWRKIRRKLISSYIKQWENNARKQLESTLEFKNELKRSDEDERIWWLAYEALRRLSNGHEKHISKPEETYEEYRLRKNAYQREYYHREMKNRIRSRLTGSIRRGLALRDSDKMGESIDDYLDYTAEELVDYLYSLKEPWMNKDNYGPYTKNWNDDDESTHTWQVDHVIPHHIFQYSSMTDQDFKDCWALKNLRPLSSKENKFKSGTTYLIELDTKYYNDNIITEQKEIYFNRIKNDKLEFYAENERKILDLKEILLKNNINFGIFSINTQGNRKSMMTKET